VWWFAISLAEAPDLFLSVLEHSCSPRVLNSVCHIKAARVLKLHVLKLHVLKLEDAAEWSL
jgi:hypothetical protein